MAERPGFTCHVDDLRRRLLDVGIVLAVGLWVGLTAAVVSIDAREAVLDANGLPATVALVVLYQIPPIGVNLYRVGSGPFSATGWRDTFFQQAPESGRCHVPVRDRRVPELW